jgi:hypothetical protein
MKKITILVLMVFGYFSNAVAVEGFNVGVSLTAGVFEADGAKEEFKGAHAGVGSPGNVSKTNATHGDEAEGLFGIGSIFAEVALNDVVAVGVDYVPMAMETETATNIQPDMTTSSTQTTKTNNVQIDFEDLTTLYVTLTPPDANGLYVKAGYMQVDVITNEKLGTGGAYGNTDLDGYTIALGYNRDLANDAFVRLELSHMELDGATLVNTADSAKSVTADGITGYGARISVGKSF